MKINILLIEDNKLDAILVQNMINNINYEINEEYKLFHIETLESSKKILESNNIDIVFLDLNLPDTNGIETIQNFREINKDIPLVAYTGTDDLTLGKKLLDSGADDYLCKNDITDSLFSKTVVLNLERYKLKQNIFHKELEYERIFDNAFIGLIYNSENRKLIKCNKKAADILGYKSVDELIGTDISNLHLNKSKFIEFEKKYSYALKNKHGLEIEYQLKKKDGTSIWCALSGKVIQNSSLSELNKGVLWSISDIQAKKEIEKKMLQAMSVFENTHDGIVITDSNVNIINVNKAFEKITGYSKDEVIGKNPSILKSNILDENFYKDMWQSIVKEGYWAGEITNQNKEGKNYQELLTINTIYDDKNSVLNYIGIFTDISLQKDQEKILLQQTRISAIGEMISNIAHQWRQPLSVISTSATGLKLNLSLDKKIDNSELMNILDTINNHTQYLSKTIDDFRSFFSGDLTGIRECNVKDTLKKVRNLTIDNFNNNFIKYIEDVDNIYINYNENILIQALINIYNNAKDALIYKRTDRYFFVSTKKSHDNLIIIIKDNAGGIKEDNVDKIFDPYFTTKHESIGTGIGLYITYQIITNQLHGLISVKNVEFNHNDQVQTGAEFLIEIPINKNI